MGYVVENGSKKSELRHRPKPEPRKQPNCRTLILWPYRTPRPQPACVILFFERADPFQATFVAILFPVQQALRGVREKWYCVFVWDALMWPE